MCDTFYFKNNNSKFFMKNSDRSPNEPNLIQFIKGSKHEKGEIVKATYIEIPEVETTYSCLLISPSWLYGAEMGINEFGVSIGNEAVFTKNPDKKTERLLGMDYLRLALERSKTSYEAAKTIINLLVKYGQGGNCGYDHEFYYDNSYLIMDKNETYILETVGYDYCLYKAEDSYNISNKLSIQNKYLVASNKYKNFEKENTDFFFTTFSMSKNREKCGKKLLSTLDVNLENAFKILSSHRINIKNGDVGSVCMHKNLIGDHTTSSMIVDYSYENPTIWLTESPSPCISIFKPYYFNTDSLLVNKTKEEQLEYYYNRMYLNRIVLSGLVNYDEYKTKVDKINMEFINGEKSLRKNNASIDELVKFQNDCYKKENEFVNNYMDLINKVKNGTIKLKGLWDELNKKVSLNPFSPILSERLKHN